MRAERLYEDPQAAPRGATIIDVDFRVVRPGAGAHARAKAKKAHPVRNYFFALLLAAVLGLAIGMAIPLLPDALAAAQAN